MYLFKLEFSSFLDIYLGMELLDHMVVLFLVLQKGSLLFSTVVAPIYIPTNSRGEYIFLHIPSASQPLLFVNFLMMAILTE